MHLQFFIDIIPYLYQFNKEMFTLSNYVYPLNVIYKHINANVPMLEDNLLMYDYIVEKVRNVPNNGISFTYYSMLYRMGIPVEDIASRYNAAPQSVEMSIRRFEASVFCRHRVSEIVKGYKLSMQMIELAEKQRAIQMSTVRSNQGYMTPVTDFNLAKRTENILTSNGLSIAQDLYTVNLRLLRNFGTGALAELNSKLSILGLPNIVWD